MRSVAAALLVLVVAMPAMRLAAEPSKVTSLDGAFVDSARRDREIPYRVYPKGQEDK